MSKPQTEVSSTGQNKLTTLSTSVILKEQTDKVEVIKVFAALLERIAMLWQIPNWSAHNSVILAEWIFDHYKYEPLDLIMNVLKDPKPAEDKIFRLTPDVIQNWMASALEDQAVRLEKENEQLKKDQRQIAESKDWTEFYKEHFFKFRDNYDPSAREAKHWSKEEAYQKAKAEWLAKKELEKKSTKD